MAEPPTQGGAPLAVPPKRTCNMHADCDAADARVREKSNGRRQYADHCRDECCEDCFGA